MAAAKKWVRCTSDVPRLTRDGVIEKRCGLDAVAAAPGQAMLAGPLWCERCACKLARLLVWVGRRTYCGQMEEEMKRAKKQQRRER